MPHASQLARAQVVEAEARFELWGLAGGKMHVREANFCESPEVGEVLRRADVVLVNNEVCVMVLRLDPLFVPSKNRKWVGKLNFFFMSFHSLVGSLQV